MTFSTIQAFQTILALANGNVAFHPLPTRPTATHIIAKLKVGCVLRRFVCACASVETLDGAVIFTVGASVIGRTAAVGRFARVGMRLVAIRIQHDTLSSVKAIRIFIADTCIGDGEAEEECNQ